MVSLIPYVGVWRFEASGLDLGTSWQTNGFDDSAWLSGPGLLQAGGAVNHPAPVRTTLPTFAGRITCYFRAEFDLGFPTVPMGLQLIATNLVDDGCVIYLNGTEAGRIRMPSTTIQYSTRASSGSANQPDVVELNSAALRPGRNLLAVEVHQVLSSDDVVWGTHLVASFPQRLVILEQPSGATNLVGESVTLSAVVDGSPVSYQWQKDGVALAGATERSLTLTPLLLTHSGDYTLMATNTLGSVTSAIARVLIRPDLVGPTVHSAIVSGTNHIDIRFSENVLRPSVTLDAFTITHVRTGSRLDVTNTIVSGPAVRVRLSEPLQLYDDYIATITGVKDSAGNVVAPGTRVPVWWNYQTNLFTWDRSWKFHAAAVFEPDIYDAPWAMPGYVPGGWWAEGRGLFYVTSAASAPCFGTFETAVGFQFEPILFRTTFQRPDDSSRSGTLRLRFHVGDGAVFLLNGVVVYRANAESALIRATSRAISGSSLFIGCDFTASVAVTNLVAGENVLGVALLQRAEGSLTGVFGMELDGIYSRIRTLPELPPPVLTIVPAGSNAIVSWDSGGAALESSTNLQDTLSYPMGPWVEVPNAGNPYHHVADAPSRAFRLKRK